MVFSDTTNLNGIIQVIERETDLGYGYISGNATKLKEFTARVNEVGHRVYNIIFNASGIWQYDDDNNTNLPQATANLVNGTGKYALPDTALTVRRVDVKDTGGIWLKMEQLSPEKINGIGWDEFQKVSGNPLYYRLIDNVLEFKPAPNYDLADGFKVFFDRGSVDFETSDTTKTPGFNSEYHEIIPIWVALDWLNVKQPTSTSIPGLTAKLKYLMNGDDNVSGLKGFYKNRNKDSKPAISRRKESFK